MVKGGAEKAAAAAKVVKESKVGASGVKRRSTYRRSHSHTGLHPVRVGRKKDGEGDGAATAGASTRARGKRKGKGAREEGDGAVTAGASTRESGKRARKGKGAREEAESEDDAMEEAPGLRASKRGKVAPNKSEEGLRGRKRSEVAAMESEEEDAEEEQQLWGDAGSSSEEDWSDVEDDEEEAAEESDGEEPLLKDRAKKPRGKGKEPKGVPVGGGKRRRKKPGVKGAQAVGQISMEFREVLNAMGRTGRARGKYSFRTLSQAEKEASAEMKERALRGFARKMADRGKCAKNTAMKSQEEYEELVKEVSPSSRVVMIAFTYVTTYMQSQMSVHMCIHTCHDMCDFTIVITYTHSHRKHHM
jgi:hypothetical protein